MTPAARLSAAIELIDTIEKDRVPAAKALKEWGTAHRFAGSGDRAAIAGLVWDVLRRYASSAYLMDSDTRARAADRHAPPRAQHGCGHDGRAVRRQPLCPGAVDRGRAGRARLAVP